MRVSGWETRLVVLKRSAGATVEVRLTARPDSTPPVHTFGQRDERSLPLSCAPRHLCQSGTQQKWSKGAGVGAGNSVRQERKEWTSQSLVRLRQCMQGTESARPTSTRGTRRGGKESFEAGLSGGRKRGREKCSGRREQDEGRARGWGWQVEADLPAIICSSSQSLVPSIHSDPETEPAASDIVPVCAPLPSRRQV